MSPDQVRLSSMAHGGGCGCKLSPAVLSALLANMPAAQPFKQLLVGTETGDDAAVWQIDEATCLISTTDFFTPMVDDPRDFGRIAATNAISDVYAMGGKPILALAILACRSARSSPSAFAKSWRAAARFARRPAFRLLAGTQSTRRSRSTGSP